MATKVTIPTTASSQQSSRTTSMTEISDTMHDSNEVSKTITEPSYPPTKTVIPILAGLFLVLFLVALDRLIIGVAIPKITNEFDSLGDVGWYGSAYLLTSCAFMLLLGKIYSCMNPKTVYLASLVVFEVGSAVCGAAPNSTALIVGRAIAGIGNAGLFQGAVVIIVYIIPLHKRPQYMGFLGAVFGVASVCGPLLGGAFTDGPGWRWCFYINLPFGALVFTLLVFFLHIPEDMMKKDTTTFRRKFQKMDPVGTLCFLPAIVCLLLALQWGGVQYAWSDSRVIALLALAAVLFIAFVTVQWWKGDSATVPGRVFFNRSIIAGAWFSFFNGAAMAVLVYFLPLWFQAIKHASATKSGIMSLPFVLSLVIMGILAGILTKKIGYYAPWMLVSSLLAPIGTGLTTTFTPSTGHSAWIGYQALFGMGFGIGNQQPSVAAQTVLPSKDVSIGASLMMFSQTLSGSIFISVGNNLFLSRLTHNFAKIPGLDIDSVANVGATELQSVVPQALLPDVLVAYNDALKAAFYLATALACMTIFGSLGMEWKSVKQGQQKKAKNGMESEQKHSSEV